MPTELLPCPFCGNKDPYFERMGTSRQSCIVECGNCGCRHESSDEGANSGRQWNERATPAEPAQQDTSHLPRFVVNGVYQNGRHFSRRFDSAADRDDWLEAEGFENMAEFKCSEEPQ